MHIEKKCHICGFRVGHYVCSQAPVNAYMNKLIGSNRALSGAARGALALLEYQKQVVGTSRHAEVMNLLEQGITDAEAVWIGNEQ